MNSRNTYALKDIQSSLDDALKNHERSFEAVVLHCGVNHLKKSTPEDCSKHYIKIIKNIETKQVESKTIVSKAAPVQDPQLNVKIDLFNALLGAELNDEKDISFINHTNPIQNKWNLRNGLHPTAERARTLAINIGRHLRGILWKRPQKRAKRSSHPPSGGFQRFPVDRRFGGPWSNRFNVLYEYDW